MRWRDFGGNAGSLAGTTDPTGRDTEQDRPAPSTPYRVKRLTPARNAELTAELVRLQAGRDGRQG